MGGYKVSKTIILCPVSKLETLDGNAEVKSKSRVVGQDSRDESDEPDDRTSLGARATDEAALVASYLQRVSPGIAKEFQVRQEIIFSSIL